MSEQERPPPPTYVLQEGQREAYGEQLSSTINALQRPTSILLFVVLIVAIIELAQYFADRIKFDANKLVWQDINEHLKQVENNRSEEMRRSQETIRELAEQVARDSENAGRAALTAIEGKVDEGAEPEPQ